MARWPAEQDAGGQLRKEQNGRVSVAIRHSFAVAVNPRDREPGPVRRVYHRETSGGAETAKSNATQGVTGPSQQM